MAARQTIIAVSIAAAGAMLASCAAQPASAPPVQQPANSILVGSTPAAGSTVSGPVNELALRFNPPARLDEVTVTGPGGTMPMMVHAVGEAPSYSIPVSGLGPGTYTVDWRASVQGQSHQGRFPFTVS
jgi:methionine-rich copper-binding protein CopC